MTAQPVPLPDRRGLELIDGSEKTRPRLRPWLIFAACVIVAFFGLIVSRISLDRSAFVLDEMEEEIAAAEADHWDLRLEVARLRDPERIATVAADMGMVYPKEIVPLDAEGPANAELFPEYRWAQLKALLNAQP